MKSKSHLYKFIQKLGFDSYQELLDHSQSQPEWFWTEALKDIGLKFETPYSHLLEQSLPWPKWASGGKISIAENCIDRHLPARSTHPALIFESDLPGASKAWTYEDLARESSYISRKLLEAQAKPGDRVALLMPMSLEMVATFFGALRLGLVVIPIFSGYGADAIASRLQDSETRFVFIQEKTTRRGKPIAVRDTLNEALKTCPKVEKVFELNRDEFWQGHASERIPSHAYASEDTCLLLYTSGTTGKPKACVHTPFGILATTGKEHRYGFDLRPEHRFFWYTDIGWMMGPWELLGALQFGAAVILYEGVPDFPDSDRLWKIIDSHQVTHLGISPTAIRVLKKSGSEYLKKSKLQSLEFLGSTGEPWDEESWLWFFEEVGKKRCPIINISGGTEIMGCLLMPNPLSDLKPCTLGGPALGAKVQAWTEDGTSISEGLGHLVCLSPLPSMTKGFLHSKERYLQTYFEKFGPNVWYHGDYAFIDQDGFWFLRGRSDDTIKIAGKRVGPNEFESALMEDSRVAEAAAIGLPHEIKGESVTCVVVLKNRSEESENLRQSLQKRTSDALGKAMAAERVLFSDALPKTRSGKILRSLIRKILMKEAVDDSSVDQSSSLEAIKNLR